MTTGDNRNAIVIGSQFGDEGKGATTAFLTSQHPDPKYVVKFSGGPQTAHNVIEPSGAHHTFAQFGSGTLQGVPTLISKYAMVNPFSLAAESVHLWELLGYNPINQVYISENSLLNTPLHGAVNKLREIARGGDRHGSCGFGVGETRHYELLGYDAPRVKDLLNPDVLLGKLKAYETLMNEQVGSLRGYSPSPEAIMADYKALVSDLNLNIVSDEEILSRLTEGYNVFEGTQGVLLDEHYGFWPHTTWTVTTAQNALQLASDAGLERPLVVGCVRSYGTRHGAGPFPSEFPTSYDWASRFPELHNVTGEFNGAWRAGLLDLPLFEHATKANGGFDVLSISHADLPFKQAVTRYELLDNNPLPLEYEANNAIHPWTELLGTDEFKASAVIEDIRSTRELVERLNSAAGLDLTTETILGMGPVTNQRTWH